MTSTVLSAKVSKTSLARSTATLATESLPWSMPVRSRTCLADPERGLKDGVEDRPDRLPLDRGAVGLADLTEDLALAQHQALQAGRDPKQVSDSPLVVVADQVPGEELGPNAVELDQEVAQGVGLGNGLGAAGQVDLDPVAGGEDHELVAGKGLAKASPGPGSHLGPSNARASRTLAGAER